ncbi:MAG: quinone oxidoreductase [Anaerolineae bacterium]
MQAIRIDKLGGPEVLKLTNIPTPQPGEGEVLVKIAASGVNFLDIYQRIGQNRRELPFVPGLEAAGVVQAVGPNETVFRPGDRVAYTSIPASYAEYAVIPADRLVPVPDSLPLAQAAAVMLQGMTAHYLTHTTYPLQPGDSCLIHAAAGGTGRLLVQLAKLRGATVIGTTSTPEKAEMARQAGADHVILYTEQDFEAETRRLTGGQGVNVVYDSVGAATFDRSLRVLKPRGMLALFGQSSGPVPPFDPGRLGWEGGSLFLTRPSLPHYINTRQELLQRAGDIFGWLAAGQISPRIERQLPLADAAEAHRLLASRTTAGKLLLIP